MLVDEHDLFSLTISLGNTVVVPDSGHYTHKDQPAAVVEAVRALSSLR
ncbi:hypothetical protein ABTW72_27200 [Micromonospora sp. NPDC127501]